MHRLGIEVPSSMKLWTDPGSHGPTPEPLCLMIPRNTSDILFHTTRRLNVLRAKQTEFDVYGEHYHWKNTKSAPPLLVNDVNRTVWMSIRSSSSADSIFQRLSYQKPIKLLLPFDVEAYRKNVRLPLWQHMSQSDTGPFLLGILTNGSELSHDCRFVSVKVS